MTTKTKDKWEEELEELPALNYNLYFGSGKDVCDKCLEFNDALIQLKSFISTLLSKQKQEIREMIEFEESKIITSKRFWLVRTEDISNVSGIGIVADGIVFPDGVAVLRWRTAGGSTGIYDSLESLEKIHGHEGKTKVKFVALSDILNKI